MQDFSYQTGLRLLNEQDIIRARVRFDDECGNGRQSFSVTGDIFTKQYYRGEETVIFNGRKYWCQSVGCLHEEISRAFPELAPYIKWHMTFTDGPMHYIANGLFWLDLWKASLDSSHPKHKDEYVTRYGSTKLLEYFKSTIIYGWGHEDEFEIIKDVFFEKLPLDVIQKWLENRLPHLMNRFMEDMEKVANLKLT